jgi:S1-C subfamily serine protease
MSVDPNSESRHRRRTGRSNRGSGRGVVMSFRRVRRIGLGLVGGLVGAGVLVGVLLAFGVFGDSSGAAASVSLPRAGSAGGLGAPLDGAGVYAAANPSVVDITASQSRSVDTGTGFFVGSAGQVLTADHVVAGASSVTVKFQDGSTVPARVLGQDRSTDVAVLSVGSSPAGVRPLALGSTGSLVVGDTLAVIGNPFGYNHSLSTGVVSAVDRTIQAPNGWLIPHALQTDAPINPGNSGGPVLDEQGSVVGIVDQIATGGSNVDSDTGVGFAVPIDLVKAELPALERGVAVAHAYLGVAAGQSTTAQPGALVQGVAAGSPAAAAGVRAGDLIIAVDGSVIHGPSALIAATAAHKPGEKLTLQLQRGPNTLTASATLTTQPTQPTTG